MFGVLAAFSCLHVSIIANWAFWVNHNNVAFLPQKNPVKYRVFGVVFQQQLAKSSAIAA
jgi:hypothetical protein